MKLKRILALVLCFAMVLSTMSFNVFADEATGNVAKVGNTEYATIEEAIAAWTNNTTLTLLADVTLSDVIKLSSTEYHILDLGTYTMTAAKNKDAIQYVINGRSSAGVALDIKADANNPGGITATSKTIVSHIKPSSNAPSKDRPITRFYGGIFNASYVVKQGGSGLFLPGAGYTGASAPYFQFYGGEYNGTIYTNRSQNQFHGGTFNGSMQMSVDSSAYTLVAGGTFKNLSNLMGSDLTTDVKFTIGSSKGANDGSVCIDENGNYVITTTTPADAEASVASNYNSNNYFYYSTVNTNGMYYEDVYDALEGNKTGTVTVFIDELDLTNSSFKGTIVVPEGEGITIIVEEGTTPAWSVSDNANVTYTDTAGNELVERDDGSFAPVEPEVSVKVDGVDVEVTDLDNNSYNIELAEGEVFPGSVTMTFPATGEMAYVVHNHNGTNYIYVGNVEDGKITITNTVGFSTFTVYEGGLQGAIDAAQENDTVVISAGEYGAINISNKSITIQGTVGADGELLTTLTGNNPVITGHGFNGTIKDLKIGECWRVMYAEPAGNVTIDNVYVTKAMYGFHLVAYSTDLTWTIQNSYMNLSWANSFGVYGDGDAAIVVKGNTFETTNPYYPDYGAYVVNTFLPNVTVEENIFLANTKVFVDASVEDTSNIVVRENYHADGYENVFPNDSDGIKGEVQSYYENVDADGNLTGLVEIPAASPVAKIGDVEYETLQKAIDAAAAMASGETEVVIQLMPGEFDCGEEVVLSVLKNVTIKGADNKGTVIKNTTITNNGKATDNITDIRFDGIVFDNSRIYINGWTAGMNFKDWTITNCEFKNLNSTTSIGGVVQFNLSSGMIIGQYGPYNDVALENFTFTNNVIDGASCNGVCSGINSAAMEGTIVIENNIFKNIDYNAVQLQNVPETATVSIKNNVLNSKKQLLHLNNNLADITITENVFIASETTPYYISHISTDIDASANFFGSGTDVTDAVLDTDYENKFSKSNSAATVTIDSYYKDAAKTELVAVTKAVAKIGDVEYATLQAAVDAAVSGDTITLIADVELKETLVIAADDEIVLDLNGKTVSMVYATDISANHAMISNNGILTIQDSASDGKLSYEYTGANAGTSYAVNTITTNPGSTLTIKSGTIENLTYDSATIAYAIDGLTNGGIGDVTVNIEGGIITSKRQAIRIFANSTTKTGTLNISGGNITGRVIVQNANANANKAAMNISGGTFNVNAYKTEVLYVGGSNGATIDMNPVVSGGIFNGKIESAITAGFITGGTFNSDVSAYVTEGYELVDNGDGTYGVEKATETVNPFKDAPLFLAALPDETVDGVTYHPVYMATSIDSLNYQKVGFDYIFSIFDPETNEVTFTAPYTTETNEVYSSISDATTTYTVDSIGGNGAYLFMNKLMFNAEYYHNNNTKITITPYAYDMNGNKITGWTFDMTNEYYKSLQTGDVKQDMFKEDAESDKPIKVTTAEQLADTLKNITEATEIDAKGLTVDMTNIGVQEGSYTKVSLQNGVSISGLNVVTKGTNQVFTTDGGQDGKIVFDGCTFKTETSFAPNKTYFQSGTNATGVKLVFNNCTFVGPVVLADNTGGGVEFNNCTFTIDAKDFGYVQCMGGEHTFNNCTFDYTGVSTNNMFNTPITKMGHLNTYSENYNTVVNLNGCNSIATNKYSYGTGVGNIHVN